jgi:hypothetical protein
MGESPDEYGYQRTRLQAAQNAGWLESGRVDFSIPRVSEVVDKTRKRMLNLSAEDVTEDNIEKTDTILAGLAYQYAMDDTAHVIVLVSDTKAEQAIEDVLTAVGVGDTTMDTTMVIEGRDFIDTLVANQLG